MDQDNSLQISFDEWRSFFMVNPVILESVTNDPQAMLRYWRSASVGHSIFSKGQKILFVIRLVFRFR